jgi:energy-coupling factor transporter transmembrane protein EcfT
MADLNPFMFRPGRSSLHSLDTRCKLFLICMMGLAILKAGFPACFFYLTILVFFLQQIRLPMGQILKHLKYFMLFLIMIFLARGLTLPGDPLFFIYKTPLSAQGLYQGALVAFRFFLVMITGLVFSATTRSASLKNAAQWYLKPIPFVPEKRVAVMISLALGFLPLILQQAQETRNAIYSRCGNLEKNPVKRFIRLTLPLLKKTFLSADHLILAMEARCYNEDRTDPEFESSGKETIFIMAGLGFWLFSLFFESLCLN